MDKNSRSYLAWFGTVIILFACILAVFAFIYRYFTLEAYNGVLFFLILLTAIITLCAFITMLAVITAYRTRRVTGIMRFPVRLGLKVMLPFTALAGGIFKRNKDPIRGLYVEVNNIFVESGAAKFKPGEVLVLLPHCIQNSKCGYKITNDINNCRECGSCCINDILKVTRELGVKAVVVTGGTAARNIVRLERPRVLVSVACERDLSAGITDVGGIPVIGIVNERPNGPCRDTTVDMELFRKKLEFILY